MYTTYNVFYTDALIVHVSWVFFLSTWLTLTYDNVETYKGTTPFPENQLITIFYDNVMQCKNYMAIMGRKVHLIDDFVML